MRSASSPRLAHERNRGRRRFSKRGDDDVMFPEQIRSRRGDAGTFRAGDGMSRNEPGERSRKQFASEPHHILLGAAGIGEHALLAEMGGDVLNHATHLAERHGQYYERSTANRLRRIT